MKVSMTIWVTFDVPDEEVKYGVKSLTVGFDNVKIMRGGGEEVNGVKDLEVATISVVKLKTE